MSPPFLVSHSHEVFLPTMHSGWFNSLGGLTKFMAILNRSGFLHTQKDYILACSRYFMWFKDKIRVRLSIPCFSLSWIYAQWLDGYESVVKYFMADNFNPFCHKVILEYFNKLISFHPFHVGISTFHLLWNGIFNRFFV